jgi:hypothetical protein
MAQLTTARRRLPYPEEQPLVPVDPDAFAALKVHRSRGFGLIRAGEFPLEVLKHGARFYVRTADLRAYLGLPLQP